MDPIRHTISVTAPPDLAFDTFAAGMGRWWDPTYSPDPGAFSGITVTPEVGGAVTMHCGGDFPFGVVTAWAPGSRFAQTFWLAMDPAAPSTVEVTFAPTDDGCRVTLEHGGWTEVNVAFRHKYGDWPVLLEGYRALLARD